MHSSLFISNVVVIAAVSTPWPVDHREYKIVLEIIGQIKANGVNLFLFSLVKILDYKR